MKKRRTSLTLGILSLITGSLLWGLIRFEVGHRTTGDHRPRPLIDWPADSVEMLRVEKPEMRIEFRHKDNRWRIVSPIQARADDVLLRFLLDKLENARIVDTIDRSEIANRDLSLADFQLDAPGLRLVLGSATRRVELLVGRGLSLEDRVYISLPPSPRVYVVDAEVFAAIPDTISGFRDDRLLDIEPRRIVQIELRRPGEPFIQLVRGARQWRLTQPVEARADAESIRRLLDNLHDARIRRFLWPRDDAAADDLLLRERLMVYGLDRDENVLLIHLRESGQALGTQLRIGLQRQIEDRTVYAHWSGDGTIAAMDEAILERFDLSSNDLRDPRVLRMLPDEIRRLQLTYAADSVELQRSGPFDRWRLSAPVADVADPQTVDAFLHALVLLRAEAFTDDPLVLEGATNPVARLELSGPGFQKQIKVWSLPDQPQWMVRLDDRDFAYRVAPEALPPALRTPLGAPEFRDKTVLALDTAAIRRLTRQTKGGDLLIIERTPDGFWRLDVPLPAMPDPAAIEDLMFAFAHLRAERVAALSARDAEAYGLRPPNLEWTVELTGDDRQRITLGIGNRAAEGGRYAMVRGRDGVFVLGPETAGAFEHPMILRPAP